MLLLTVFVNVLLVAIEYLIEGELSWKVFEKKPCYEVSSEKALRCSFEI